jgi:hypothetical protein
LVFITKAFDARWSVFANFNSILFDSIVADVEGKEIFTLSELVNVNLNITILWVETQLTEVPKPVAVPQFFLIVLWYFFLAVLAIYFFQFIIILVLLNPFLPEVHEILRVLSHHLANVEISTELLVNLHLHWIYIIL